MAAHHLNFDLKVSNSDWLIYETHLHTMGQSNRVKTTQIKFHVAAQKWSGLRSTIIHLETIFVKRTSKESFPNLVVLFPKNFSILSSKKT